MYRVALTLLAPLLALFLTFADARPAQALEAYLFRGAGDFSFLGKGLTFSNGMDRLGEKLDAAGVPARVYRWEAVDWAYRDIMKRRPDAVMIMGHSMGALSTVTLASKLKGSGIRVAYIGTIDIPGPTALAPSNVEVAENFYHAFPVYGMLGRGPGFNGALSNQYVLGQIHITMDKSQKVHSAALEFVSKSRGSAPTMVAFAQQPEPQSDVLGQVDQVLTGTAQASQPGMMTAVSTYSPLPDAVPLPTRSPLSGATGAKLPPIE